jgi:MFS family permease
VYVLDILHGTVGQAQLLPALMLLTTMLVAVPIGILGDHLGKRRVMGAGTIVIGCAALSGLVITTPLQGVFTFLLAGIGSAAVIVLTVPLLADLVPRHHMGTATGALAAAGSIAAPLSSLAAGGLSDLFGPRAIFGLMAGMIAIALALLPFTQPPSTVGDDPAGASGAWPEQPREASDVQAPG